MGKKILRIGRQGVTLLEVLMFLAIFAILAAVLVPFIFGELTLSREEETRQEIEKLVEAIAGKPELGTFGFVGDFGRLPNTLSELNSAITPAFHTADGGTNHRGVVGMGWNGPYFKEEFFSGDNLKDAWGTDYQYTVTSETRVEGGVSLTTSKGQIVSAGSDKQFGNSDDIKSELFYDKGHLFLTVTQGGGDQPANNVTATLFFPVNGEQSSIVSEPTPVAAPEGSETTIVFASVPGGSRFVQIDFGGSKHEIFYVGLTSNIANRINVKVPLGQGGKA
ncbi:MAG: prepilin-type N-terminal cleavage/methylation domain-containing protein [Deltaproteobacteria bacterium]|nr:prepilin-type N-terminal cleavage/methylation domain-containing protein [Deltaproteobacteria bacterium]